MSSEQAVRDEMVALLRYANLTAIGRELGVSAQAVKNWANGKNTSPARLVQVRRLYGLDAEKNAAPEGAAEQLLKLWTGDQPPAWSNVQVGKVIEEIRRDRAAAMLTMARQLGRMTAAELQQLLTRLPDGSAPGTSDQ